MWRVALKGAALFGCGWFPGGAKFYRDLTRSRMGTQATHVDKLCRVWPDYTEVWQTRCGLRLEGLDIWVHEGGWTPCAPLLSYLLTGKGGVLTNTEGRVLDRYLAKAVNGALAAKFPEDLIPQVRRERLEPLRWLESAEEAIQAVGGRPIEGERPEALPLDSASIDLCHSGGALEHYRPERLLEFLKECHRILRPGGIASHVFDHRDHLHHADRRLPFLAHLALPSSLYGFCCGHPLGYHNRLSPAEVQTLFERAGFEPIAVRRLIYPARHYAEGDAVLNGSVGLPRARLAAAFRAISEADLRTAAAHYLYRKK